VQGLSACSLQHKRCFTDQGRFGVNQPPSSLAIDLEIRRRPLIGKSRSAPKDDSSRSDTKQPAVGHQVHRFVGRFHLDRAKRRFPMLPDDFQCRLGRTGFTVAFDQVLRVRQVGPVPRQNRISRSSPSAKSSFTCIAPQGSSPAPVSPERLLLLQGDRIRHTSIPA